MDNNIIIYVYKQKMSYTESDIVYVELCGFVKSNDMNKIIRMLNGF